MIDTLEANREKTSALTLSDIININLSQPYYLPGNSLIIECRDYSSPPSNVDNKEVMIPLIAIPLNDVATEFTLIWPVHPRTIKQLDAIGLWNG